MVPAAVTSPRLYGVPAGGRPAGGPDRFVADLLMELRRVQDQGHVLLGRVREGGLSHPSEAVADLVHHLFILHGERPSLLDIAAADGGFESAAALFHHDRRWLADLAVVTGPGLDLRGISDSERSARETRDAMLVLMNSTRAGAALGAAADFVMAWPRLRERLNVAGMLAFGGAWLAPQSLWPDDLRRTAEQALRTAAADEKSRRALRFGAVQLAAMHRSLFELLETRAAAR